MTAGSTTSSTCVSFFKGNTKDMNGHVLERCDKQLNSSRQLAKAMEALEAYVKKNLSYSKDLAPLFTTMARENPTIYEPADIEDNPSKLKKMIFAEEVKKFVQRTRLLKSNMATIHTVLIWGQCSENIIY